ncbi:alpha/beta fold hydrolase [Oceanivirga salmonicida]|uniref:alpha/beta fold hydrolase n=1 Tax=Oceanivirga salmonicida TaxID=1769291 RepID=UPI0012E31198|nr:alpha/beta hydrolase [Oceanivirga salmonicida]
MIIKEFGNKSNKTIILLHGGGLSWWSLKNIISILELDYHIITPIIDGHGEDGNTVFTSIEDMSNKLISYINKSCNKKVYAICGLSIGAQIVVDILSKEKDICEYAIIESALIKPLKIRNLLVKMVKIAYPLSKWKWLSKLQAKYIYLPEDCYDLFYEDTCKMSFKSMENIIRSNENFKAKESLKDSSVKIAILVGEKELNAVKQSANELNTMIKNSYVYIAPNCRHGEISLRYPEEYCKIFYKLINSNYSL